MKIAVTYENGRVFQHFGHTEQFALYDVQDGEIIGCETLGTNGTGHGALAGFLKDNGADILICGNIGQGAKDALQSAGIRLIAGAAGDTRKAVQDFLAGTLVHDPSVKCNHHHQAGHTCGHHNCHS